MDKKWYTVYIKIGTEKKVADTFTRKKIENFSPINKLRSRDENKKVKEVPLFKGYIFVKVNELQLEEIKKVNDVINLVYWMGTPVIIKNSEIKVIKLFLDEYENVTLEKTSVTESIVNIRDNKNAELDAPMITIKNKKAYVGLPSLGYIMMAEAEAPNVRIISVESVLRSADSKLNKLLNKVSKFDNSSKSF